MVKVELSRLLSGKSGLLSLIFFHFNATIQAYAKEVYQMGLCTLDSYHRRQKIAALFIKPEQTEPHS